MSSRLVILPKKSYCPWNRKNVERVERDEREHRAEEERKRAEEARENSRSRLLSLKRQDGNDDGTLKRFSLFSEEERKHLEEQKDQQSISVNDRNLERNRGQKFDNKCGSFLVQKRAVPFYMLPRYNEKDRLDTKDTKLKREMDPMKHIHGDREEEADNKKMSIGSTGKTEVATTKDRKRCRGEYNSQSIEDEDGSLSDGDSSVRRKEKKRRHKKKSKKHRKDSDRRKRRRSSKHQTTTDQGEDEPPTIEELRRRRAEREERERKRQEIFIRNSRVDGRDGKYADQYNPHLSRI